MSWARATGEVLRRLCDSLQDRKASPRRVAAGGLILDRLGLSLHSEKTRVVGIADGRDGFDFLGFHCQKVESWRKPGRRFLWIWPGRRAMERVRERIKAITARRARLLLPLQQLVVKLNPVLRGWGAYFRVSNAGAQFAQIDRYISERLALFLHKKAGRSSRGWKKRYTWAFFKRVGVYRLTGTVARHKAAPTAAR